MPKISFVIPYYNVPTPLFKECVESILALSLTDDEREIIVVDDGSKESPAELLTAYGSSIVCVRQENGGASAARNTGIEMARGEYIQFVDADDAIIKEAYDTIIERAKEGRADIILFDYTEQNGDDDMKSRKQNNKNGQQDGQFFSAPDYMARFNISASPWLYLFRKKILGDHRFVRGLLNEDELFTALLFARDCKLCKVSNVAYFYRRREDSLTTKTDIDRLLHRLNDLEKTIYNLRDAALEEHKESAVCQQALLRRAHQLTMDYIYNTIIFTRSWRELTSRTERLQQNGMYPLAIKDYTITYKWFCRVANHRLGLAALSITLPLICKKR